MGTQHMEEPKQVRGYRVRVRHSSEGDVDDAKRSRDAIASILAKSLKDEKR
jgi:anionic cell wall polymer biosynthesis LytR-Cps2A-Psr (LCP) family protein